MQPTIHRPTRTSGQVPPHPPLMSPRQVWPQPVLQHLCPWGQDASPTHSSSHGRGSAGHVPPNPSFGLETGTTQRFLQPNVQHFFTPGHVSSVVHLLKQDCFWATLGQSPFLPLGMSPRQTQPQPVLQHFCPAGHDSSPWHSSLHGFLSRGHSPSFTVVTQDARDPRAKSAFRRKKLLDILMMLRVEIRSQFWSEMDTCPEYQLREAQD